MNPIFSSRTVLFSLSIAFIASGCLKTRSALKGQTDNPDSGYSTKVTEVSKSENQVVAEELRGEINQLNGRIDELQRKNEALAKDQVKKSERDNQMRDLEAKIQELQASQSAMIDALQKKQLEREKEKEIPKADPTKAYEKARAAQKEKKYDEAIETFSEYLKFPKGKHTEDAYFFRGEAYFSKGLHKKAIVDYAALQEKYAKSKFISKSLLKTGMAFEALGMESDSKVFYKEILAKHPKSAEAKTAKTKLKQAP